MIHLKKTTLLGCTTRDHDTTLAALLHTQGMIEFANVVYFSDQGPDLIKYPIKDLTYVPLAKFIKYEEISVFALTILPAHAYLFSDHILSIHWDGYPCLPEAWQDEFLGYDFIGCPYPTGEVGGMGLYIASQAMLKAIKDLNFKPTIENCFPDDQLLFRRHKDFLKSQSINIAPSDLAIKFSNTTHLHNGRWKGYSYNGSFGFHGLGGIPTMKNFPVKLLPEHQGQVSQEAEPMFLVPPNRYSDGYSMSYLVNDSVIYNMNGKTA